MINYMFLDYKDCSWKLEIESSNLCRIIIISNTTIKIINKDVRIMIGNTRLNRFSLKILVFSQQSRIKENIQGKYTSKLILPLRLFLEAFFLWKLEVLLCEE